LKTSVIERFIRYAKIDTQSDHYSESFPSTLKQLDLAKVLLAELKEIGLSDIHLDASGYVYATLPATVTGAPVIGFIAHMDTSPDLSGTNVNPQRVHYQGGDIILNQAKGICLSPKEFPDLLNYIGEDLLTTDGNTLLGADDKAGIAEIMAAVEYLAAHPEIPHGTVKVAFTPDEEVGHGADRFDVPAFGADFAYTMDGGAIGELEYENFNAASAKVTITGRNVHPGIAKDKMINSMQIAIDFHNLLPVNQRPEYTDHYDGFYHLTEFNGSVEETVLRYIVREHDRAKFEKLKAVMQQDADVWNARFGEGTVKLEIVDSYYNMKEMIEPNMQIIDLAYRAMESLNITPKIQPIRGGTDGSRLSYMGLPCPNLFTGGHYFHGRFEFIVISSMEKAVEVIIRILELAAKKS
jgi:tripeptide aminopeptidase